MAWQQPPAVCSTCRSHLSGRHHGGETVLTECTRCVYFKSKRLYLKRSTWCLFFCFFFRSVKFNCWVSPHILIRDGMCLTANKLSLPDLWQMSLSLQSISGSPAGPSKQRCSSGGEAEEKLQTACFIFVALALHPTPSPPSMTLDSLRPSHPDTR